jgi:hypothetical protein
MIINGVTVRGSACACTSYHAYCPTVGITQHKRAAERNTTSIPATMLLYSFIYAHQWLQGTAVVFKRLVAESSAFHVLRHFKVSGLRTVFFFKLKQMLFNGHFSV